MITAMAVSATRAERLLETGLALASELSLPALLQRIIEIAVDLTGARYGALGVLASDGVHLSDFITAGLTDADREAIGHLPTGEGILGVLITAPEPLRLADIALDARSVGFPPNHPPMRSFLGAPIRAHGHVFGNIYLTDKQHETAFTGDDQASLEILATQAGVAIANAQLYEEVHLRERWLELGSRGHHHAARRRSRARRPAARGTRCAGARRRRHGDHQRP